MTRFIAPLLTLPLLLSVPVGAQQQETYDYWQGQREMVQRGQQAIFTCNGLFTSNRALQEIFAQELPYLRKPVGTAQGGDYTVTGTAGPWLSGPPVAPFPSCALHSVKASDA